MRMRVVRWQLCRPTKCKKKALSAFPQSAFLAYIHCSTLTVAFPLWFDAPVVHTSKNSSILFKLFLSLVSSTSPFLSAQYDVYTKITTAATHTHSV